MAKIITVASGKGGVGKTSISLNLSLALADAGYRVCLFDADLGLANVNILTGIYPEHGLADVMDGKKSLSQIMIREFNGIDIIPGSSGVARLADLDTAGARRLLNGFENLTDYDFFILDTSAGISAQVLAFCRAAHEMILVATPEPTSLTDAYALMKVLAKSPPLPRVRVIVNQVQSVPAAKKAWAKLKGTVHKYLSLTLSPLGILARDPNVPVAVASQIPFFTLFPDTRASRCIRAMARKFSDNTDEGMPMDAFWDLCLGLLAGDRPDTRRSSSPEPDPKSSNNNSGLSANQRAVLEDRLTEMEKDIARLLDGMNEIKTLLQEEAPHPREAQKPNPGRRKSDRKPPDQNTIVPITLDFEAWIAEKNRA
ncbi:MAG: MinD/ParA family protein [Desulfobacterales bacterium]|nr:MinD/ParA family protein [Desulfobacterales bacterium]